MSIGNSLKSIKEPSAILALTLLGMLVIALVSTASWKVFDKSQKETCSGEYRTTECLVKLTAKTKAKEDYDKLIKAIDNAESNKTVP